MAKIVQLCLALSLICSCALGFEGVFTGPAGTFYLCEADSTHLVGSFVSLAPGGNAWLSGNIEGNSSVGLVKFGTVSASYTLTLSGDTISATTTIDSTVLTGVRTTDLPDMFNCTRNSPFASSSWAGVYNETSIGVPLYMCNADSTHYVGSYPDLDGWVSFVAVSSGAYITGNYEEGNYDKGTATFVFIAEGQYVGKWENGTDSGDWVPGHNSTRVGDASLDQCTSNSRYNSTQWAGYWNDGEGTTLNPMSFCAADSRHFVGSYSGLDGFVAMTLSNNGAYMTGTYVESNPAEQGNVTLVLIANGKYVGHYTNSDGQSGDWTDTANAVHQSLSVTLQNCTANSPYTTSSWKGLWSNSTGNYENPLAFCHADSTHLVGSYPTPNGFLVVKPQNNGAYVVGDYIETGETGSITLILLSSNTYVGTFTTNGVTSDWTVGFVATRKEEASTLEQCTASSPYSDWDGEWADVADSTNRLSSCYGSSSHIIGSYPKQHGFLSLATSSNGAFSTGPYQESGDNGVVTLVLISENQYVGTFDSPTDGKGDWIPGSYAERTSNSFNLAECTQYSPYNSTWIGLWRSTVNNTLSVSICEDTAANDVSVKVNGLTVSFGGDIKNNGSYVEASGAYLVLIDTNEFVGRYINAGTYYDVVPFGGSAEKVSNSCDAPTTTTTGPATTGSDDSSASVISSSIIALIAVVALML